MCGRYYLGEEQKAEALRALFHAEDRTRADTKTAGEVFPADTVPVLACSRALAPTLYPMTWGYAMPDGRRLINARSETAADKPLFAESLRIHRCIVPARNYFEWSHGTGPRTKYALRPASGEMLCLAGLYRLERGVPVFCILTRPPEASIAFIHNRMPLILPLTAAGAWIDPRNPVQPLLAQAVSALAYEPVPSDRPQQIALPLGEE